MVSTDNLTSNSPKGVDKCPSKDAGWWQLPHLSPVKVPQDDSSWLPGCVTGCWPLSPSCGASRAAAWRELLLHLLQRLNCCYTDGLHDTGAMLLLVVLLTGLGGLHAGRKSHKSFLHTTVPERISSTDAKHDRENRIAYIITIEGKPYFVHLKKQSFLSPSSLIYSYDKNGTEHSEPLLAQMNCNYNGYVAGFINSLVTLNTCSGLRGIMQFKDVSYGIEPIDALSGFIHMIYEEKSNQINIPHSGKRVIYAESDESPHEGKKAIPKNEYASSLFPRYLELHIVVDKNLRKEEIENNCGGFGQNHWKAGVARDDDGRLRVGQLADEEF
ncbi:disintegrin and metalloproteinase domain-containing protein 5-like [Ictidomys tridecemlineatus]